MKSVLAADSTTLSTRVNEKDVNRNRQIELWEPNKYLQSIFTFHLPGACEAFM